MTMAKKEKALILLHSLYVAIVSAMIIWQIVFTPFRAKFDSSELWIISLSILCCLPVIGLFSVYKAFSNPIHSAILHIIFWLPQVVVLLIQRANKVAPQNISGAFKSYIFNARGGPSYGFYFGLNVSDKPSNQQGIFEIISIDINLIAIVLIILSFIIWAKNKTEPVAVVDSQGGARVGS